MPGSREETDSLKEQYHHLRRDWDCYMDSLPRRRHLRRHSIADLTGATPDLLLLDSSPRMLVSSLQQPLPDPRMSGGRRLLKAFENAKDADDATEAAASSHSRSSISSSSTLVWREVRDDESLLSSSSSSELMVVKDGIWRREKGAAYHWMVRAGWFAVAVVALALGFIYVAVMFGKEEIGQCMTPT